MKKLLVLAGAVIFTFAAVPLVVAQEDTNSDTTTESSAPTEVDETMQTDVKAEREAAREARRAEREARHADKLAEIDEKRVQNRCKASQNKLSAASNRATAVFANRVEVYNALGDRIDAVIARLENNGLDASEVKTQKTNLETLIQDFITEFESFLVALDDAAVLDCEADPEAFILALEDARSQITELKDQSKDIRDFVVNELKDAVLQLKSQFNEDSTDETDSSSEENDNESTGEES